MSTSVLEPFACGQEEGFGAPCGFDTGGSPVSKRLEKLPRGPASTHLLCRLACFVDAADTSCRVQLPPSVSTDSRSEVGCRSGRRDGRKNC